MKNKGYKLSFALDLRRQKANGVFPVKLVVYDTHLKKNRHHQTPFEFSESDFQSIWLTTRTRSEFLEKRLEMNAYLARAVEVANAIEHFSIEEFSSKFYRDPRSSSNVFFYYEQIIEKNRAIKSIGNADMYSGSMKSIKAFIEFNGKKKIDYLDFAEITVNWLEKYEFYMTKTMQRTRTTVSMYLRCLKAVFNQAITKNEIPAEIYPFGKRKYMVPASRNVKKALNAEELKVLFESKPFTKEQEKARDFWFFSYFCNGMNIKDIASLKWKHFENDKLVIHRAKTIRTSSNSLPIVAFLNETTLAYINKYATKDRLRENYIFPILNNEMNDEEKHTKVKNFTRFINQNFKKYAKSCGVDKEVSTYWARHSFVTQAIRSGASMELVSKLLTHENMKTTIGYFAGHSDQTMREMAQKLLIF